MSNQIGNKRLFFQEINTEKITDLGYHHFTTPNKIMNSNSGNNQQKMINIKNQQQKNINERRILQ